MPVFQTPQGGRIITDRLMIALWHQADGMNLEDILAHYREHVREEYIRTALACLAEAGLLIRQGEQVFPLSYLPVQGEFVSVILVSFNSRYWLEKSLPSLHSQSYSPIEVIMVDNASRDGSVEWVEENYPQIKLVALSEQQSLAHAINRGIEQAIGDYFLLINPDVELAPDALAEMIKVGKEHSGWAAIAPKIRLLRTPTFINGVGNFVGAFSWGTDNGLGHLDLGQFDNLTRLLSACFAAVLIPRHAWDEIGPLDEVYSLYYEDSDWCYRARLKRFTILAAPGAVLYHAFEGSFLTQGGEGLNPIKLQNVVYGRWRWAIKLLPTAKLVRFGMSYLFEEIIGVILALFGRKINTLRAYYLTWKRLALSFSDLWRERERSSFHVKANASAVFSFSEAATSPLIWRGKPELTWHLAISHYLPLIINNKTRSLAEFESFFPQMPKDEEYSLNSIQKAWLIWRTQGWGRLMQRLWRAIQWQLMKP